MAHLASEKKRRANINGGFEALRSVVPACQPCHSKADILRKAVEHISHLSRAVSPDATRLAFAAAAAAAAAATAADQPGRPAPGSSPAASPPAMPTLVSDDVEDARELKGRLAAALRQLDALRKQKDELQGQFDELQTQARVRSPPVVPAVLPKREPPSAASHSEAVAAAAASLTALVIPQASARRVAPVPTVPVVQPTAGYPSMPIYAPGGSPFSVPLFVPHPASFSMLAPAAPGAPYGVPATATASHFAQGPSTVLAPPMPTAGSAPRPISAVTKQAIASSVAHRKRAAALDDAPALASKRPPFTQ